jgi:hypothetical protein
MADPISLIGLVATVIQLVAAAEQVSSYLSDVRNASAEQKQLSEEIGYIKPLLQELKKVCDRGAVHVAGPDDPRLHGMQNLESTLAECDRKLVALTSTLENARTSWKRLIWTKYKGEIKDMLVSVEQFKSLLAGWLHLEIWYEFP